MRLKKVIRRCGTGEELLGGPELVYSEIFRVVDAVGGGVDIITENDSWDWKRLINFCRDKEFGLYDDTYGVADENYWDGNAFYYQGYSPTAGDFPGWQYGTDEGGEPWGPLLGVLNVVSLTTPPTGTGWRRRLRVSWNCCNCQCNRTRHEYSAITSVASSIQ
jgi:hypothetical protein